ncbi:MAG TPA: sugar phosphate nucleotidyltransferase [Acidobacteriaceae bacterium]|nr:sugar phosphate nucleotidyltransferase [Acidobacteriaceae bacterium]
MSAGHSHPQPPLAAIILAGGSGTRFWPRSRKARAKQVLKLDGEGTMIQGTVDRLREMLSPENIWVITNPLLSPTIVEQLPDILPDRVLLEPEARNTAPACALVAFLLEKKAPETVLGVFPSDHTIGDPVRFRLVLRAAAHLAASGPKMVVLGVPPTRPETGYGYIELGAASVPVRVGEECISVRRVRRFTEKPDSLRARAFVRSGNYVWNSGIFLWSAGTLASAVREHKPEMAEVLERIAGAFGTPEFEARFKELYPICESISIDYAILEPRSAKGEALSQLYCLPADFAWNDLGSWAALYEHMADVNDPQSVNVIEASHGVEITSSGCYVYSPGKAVALVGVQDLVVVETEDALLITTRDGSQNVGKVVAELRKTGREDLT